MAFTVEHWRYRAVGVLGRWRAASVVTTVVFGLSACGGNPAVPGGGGQPGATTSHVVIASPAYTAGSWDAYIAEDQGFFEANGLSTEFLSAPGPSATMAAIGTGSAQTGSSLVGAGIGSIMQRLPVRLIAMENVRTVVSVVGAKDVAHPSQIKGKRLAVTSATDQQGAAVTRWLATQGVAATDYERVFIPSSAQRLTALQSGAVAAAALASPADFQATSEGFTLLKAINDSGYVGAHFANASWATTPQATQYLKAIIQAIRFLYDPANKDAAIQTLVKYAKITPEAAASAYEQYVVGHIYPENLATSDQDVRTSMDEADASGNAPGARGRAVTDVADLSALKKAQDGD